MTKLEKCDKCGLKFDIDYFCYYYDEDEGKIMCERCCEKMQGKTDEPAG